MAWHDWFTDCFLHYRAGVTNCGNDFLYDYNYCPWCGVHKDQKTLKDYMSEEDSALTKAIKEQLHNDCKACQESGYELMDCPFCPGKMMKHFCDYVKENCDKVQRQENGD